MKKLAIVVFVTACSCAFGGDISGIYFKSLRTNPSDRLTDRVVNTSQVISTNNGITEIGIERSGCYGSCPIYTFIVKSDGTFRYKGENYVERKGEFTGTINVLEFNQLTQFLKESGYMELKNTYTRGVTDGPTIYTTVVMNGRQKVISDYGNSGPIKLWAMEQLIDNLLTKAKWNDSSTGVDKKK